jgi:hypothetical protein
VLNTASRSFVQQEQRVDNNIGDPDHQFNDVGAGFEPCRHRLHSLKAVKAEFQGDGDNKESG